MRLLVITLLLAACTPEASAPVERPPPRKVAKMAAPSPEPAPSVAASSPPPVPSAPTYDLAQDLAARQQLAKDELGAKTDTERVEGVFLVAAPGGRAALSGAIDVTRRALAAYFNGRFEHRPERVISVYLFPNAAPYDAYCKKLWRTKCDSPYGFYLASERKIIMNVGPGIGTLTHELVHPLVEADFPDAPDWINEGIASLFEQFHLPRPGEIRGSKNWRHPRLAAALASPKEREHATLPALFAMNDDEFRGAREDLNYATARYLCQWLDERGLLWRFYQRWRDTRATDPSGEKAFREVTGETPLEAHGKWARWVRAL
ncbi:MAG: hypothetical protein HYZ29_33490 [Myxococcales bacterium]|nr:hypothetical protein [Myxococcales bacterium]